MRRRRQRNPLLTRIIVISVIVHIIALPVLAKFGAFKKIQQQFVEAHMVVLPPPEPIKEKPEVRKAPRAAPKQAAAKRSSATTAHQKQAAQKSNLNQPKVVASTAPGDGSGDGGPTVDANGSGKAGELPTEKTDTTQPTVKEDTTPAPTVKKEDVPKLEAVKPVAQAENPASKGNTSETKPEPTPPVKKTPVLTEAEASFAPQPTIPDELRAEALDKTVVVEIKVGADGMPGEVTLTQATSNAELDRLALETARKWRFKPATRDGVPTESRVRLHIEFQVN